MDSDPDPVPKPALRHPRTIALFRAVLGAGTAVAVVGVVGLGLSILGATVVLTGVSLVFTGDANAFGFALLAGTGVLTTAGLALGIVVTARRIDRRVTAWDLGPDPLRELRQAYVAGEIDEVTFERRIGRLLVGDEPTPRRWPRLRRVPGRVGEALGDRVRGPARRDRATEERERGRDPGPKLT
jgi:hypothetical protein